MKNKKYLAISIPTGIGLETGGYAGDFGAIAREFSKYFNLIINPNAVNGGILSAINENMLYTEGFAFDDFLCNKINLKPITEPNKIGVIFDKEIPENILNIHINTINAMSVVKGIKVHKMIMTNENVGVEFKIDKETHISNGKILNPKTLYDAAKTLIDNGCTAICIVCLFKDYEETDEKNYIEGNGIDPIGGIEAVISHYLVKKFKVMAAHVPAFLNIDISEKIENPKVASEMISSTYMPCVLEGLQYAPKITKKDGVNVKNITGLVVPYRSLGSRGVLGAIENNIPLFLVKNESQLNVGCESIKINDNMLFDDYFKLLEHLKENYV